MNLSIVIITKNEEHNIRRCIQSCLPLGAEVLVLDSSSTDDTVYIAKELGAKVIDVDWKGYGATKNIGAAQASNDWILSLDADEELNEALQDAVKIAVENETGVQGYWLRRTMVYNGKNLNFGAVRNERRLRLYKKSRLHWNNSVVHELLEPIEKSANLPFGELQGSLLHYSYTDAQDMGNRLDKYARLGAQKYSKKGKAYLYFKRFVNPKFSFINNYFFRMGFVEGKEGFEFAKALASYTFKKYDYALQSIS